MNDPLEAALEGLAEPPVRARLAAYGRLLLAANARLNLSAAREPAEVAAHIADSLTLLPFVRDPLVDVGSGGGFPALPLAIASGARVTLIESVAKKAHFLEEAATALGLPVTVVIARAEAAAHDPALRDRFAAATARAVGSTPTVLELTLPFLASGGVALLQRGRLSDEERQAASDAALMLGGALTDEIALDGVRRILVLEKRGPTPARFPRRTGIPHKRPLCSRPLAAAARGAVDLRGPADD